MSGNTARRGALIVFEGLDHSGKTTQAKMVVSALLKRGVDVVSEPWRFPDRKTPIGQMISAYLSNATAMDDRALHLLFSANRWEKVEQMNDLIKQGTTIVVDRYAYSGVAYTSAKGYDVDWCKQCDAGLPSPDAVVFIKLPIDVAASRGTFGQEKYETQEMQEKVREVFGTLAGGTAWHEVDGVGDIDRVHERCMAVVEEAIEKGRQGTPMETLWN